MKKSVSFSVSEKTIALLNKLVKKGHLNKSQIISIGVELYEREMNKGAS